MLLKALLYCEIPKISPQGYTFSKNLSFVEAYTHAKHEFENWQDNRLNILR